jgi:hypothetical protein
LTSKFAPGSDTSTVKGLDVFDPAALTAPIVKLNSPALFGEPVILPVVRLSVTPSGKDPDATKYVGVG